MLYIYINIKLPKYDVSNVLSKYSKYSLVLYFVYIVANNQNI